MWRDLQQRLKLRQIDLQLRSAELRVQLAQDVRAMEQPLQWADRAQGVWRLVRRLPTAWKALGALGGLGGLIGLARLFGRSGRLPRLPRLARLWTWLTLARRIWRFVRPREGSQPDGSQRHAP